MFYQHNIKKTNTLVPYESNSRTHSDEQVAQICASITEWGFTNPILIDPDGGVIAGHGRLQAAIILGLDDVPCITIDGLTEAQRKAYVLADNQLATNAGWDLNLLKIELQDLKSMEFDLSLLGFDGEFTSELLTEIPEGETEDDAVPDAPSVPVTVAGDVWLMGNHRLMCGDSTSIDHLEQLCEGRLVDMWITDPPYNVEYVGKTSDALTIQNDNMNDDQFRQFLVDSYSAADAVMKAGAVFYIWHADSEGYNFRGAAHDIGWQVRQCLIWKKQTLVMGRQDYHWKHEPCLYGWKSGAAHLWSTDRKQTTILEFDRPQRSSVHPTMKPVDLFEYQILNNTKGSDLILDSFAGSGTTLIACEKNRRDARLMELDPKYCDVIVKRWEEYTGKKATLESTGDQFTQEVTA